MKAVISIEALERYARALQDERAQRELHNQDAGAESLSFALRQFDSIVLHSAELAREDDE